MAKKSKDRTVLKSIIPTGMQVSGSDLNVGDNGKCLEIINMRFKHNAWQVVGDGNSESFKGIDDKNDYALIYKHPVSDSKTNTVYYAKNTNNIKLLNSSGSTTILLTLTEDLISIEHSNNILLVCTESRTYYLLWNFDTAAYVSLPQVETPQISMGFTKEVQETDAVNVNTSIGEDEETAFDLSLGNYAQVLNTWLTDGYTEGHIFVRVAYRLFDGSHIMHSHPIHLRIGQLQTYLLNEDKFQFYFTYQSPEKGWFKNITLGLPTMNWLFTAAQKTNLESWKGVVQSMRIFFSPAISHYIKIEEQGFPDKYDLAIPVGQERRYMPNINVDGVKDAIKLENYYLVDTISFDELIGAPTERNIKYPTNIETKPTLPVDSFSHHRLAGRLGYVFNSRLHLGNIKTTLGYGSNLSHYTATAQLDYLENILYSTWIQSINPTAFYTLIELETEFGTKTILKPIPITYIYDKTPQRYIFFNPVLSYPDSRATSIKILQKFGSTYYLTRYRTEAGGTYLSEFILTPHNILNIAYYTDELLEILQVLYYDNVTDAVGYGGWVSIPTPTEDKTFSDENRMQVSKIDNPFVYPAENSYQIKNTEAVIRGISSVVSPTSETKYSEFPIYVFTSVGIWVLSQGQGDVLYSTIQEISEDECYENKVMAVGGGVAFLNSNGLFIVSGRTVKKMSDHIEGTPTTSIAGDEFKKLIDHSTLVELSDYISTDDFRTYITGANMAFNNKEKELIISNGSYKYSYILNITKGFWHKRSDSYQFFVRSYPGYSGFDTSSGYDLTEISNEQDVYKDCIIQTRPITFGTEAMKYIERLILRMEYQVNPDDDENRHISLYIYGSVDGSNYALLRGRSSPYQSGMDIIVNRTASPCRFFIFLFVGNIKNSFITKLDAALKLKYIRKLR